MVEQIDSLAYNILAAGRELYLPGIGSLFTERFGAKRVTSTSMEQPRRIVAFTEQRRGISLEEEIARAAGVDEEKAHAMYEEWLSQALNEETLTIKGVGELKRESFTMCDEFAEAINRQGHGRIRIKPRRNTVLYSFATLCCVFALVVAGYVIVDNQGKDDQPAMVQSSATSDTGAATDKAAENMVAADNDTTAQAAQSAPDTASNVAANTATAEAKPEEASAAGAADNMETILDCTPGRHYVVYGIFSTPENAIRAAREARGKAENPICRIYRYGTRYMVSVYEDDDRNECLGYMDSHAREFRDTWIYTKKQ